MSLIVEKGFKHVAGDVLDPEYEQEIEIENWKWTLSRHEDDEDNEDDDGKGKFINVPRAGQVVQPGRQGSHRVTSNGQPGEKASAPRTIADVFKFSKTMDRASTQMLRLMASGEALKAVVTLVQSTDSPFKLVVELDNVRISSYSFEARDNEKNASIEEEWEFTYQSITLHHEHVHDTGRSRATRTLTTQHTRTLEKKKEKKEDDGKANKADKADKSMMAKIDKLQKELKQVKVGSQQNASFKKQANTQKVP